MGDDIPGFYSFLVSLSLLGLVGTYLAGWLVFILLKRFRVVDEPVATSSHDQAVVTGGGLSFLLTWFFAALFFEIEGLGGLALAVAMVAFVSLWDDINGLPIRPRLYVHILATIIILSQMAIADMGWGFLLFAGFWIIGSTNAFNFFDGLNGLLSVSVVVSTAMASAICLIFEVQPVLGAVFLIIAVSALGFLPHNFPNPRLFLGDVGSTTLGFVMGFVTVAVFLEVSPMVALAIIIPQMGLILDISITVAWRIFTRKIWLHPHRGFFFHKLMRSGFSHLRVTSTYAAIQIGTAMLAIGAMATGKAWAVPAAAVATFVVWAAFFAFCERRFNAKAQPHAASQ